MEIERAHLRRRVEYTQPKEAREEDEVEETREGLGRVGVKNPRDRVRFDALELRTRAGATVRGG